MNEHLLGLAVPHVLLQGYSTSVASGPNKKIKGGVRAAKIDVVKQQTSDKHRYEPVSQYALQIRKRRC